MLFRPDSFKGERRGMAKIIVGFSNRQALAKISAALERNGFTVLRQCLTGNEVMRAFSMCQDGILVCGARFPDRMADQIAEDLGENALMLIADRPEKLEMCDNPDASRLPMPFSTAELVNAVQALVELHDARMPRRSESERAEVERAKAELMRRMNLSEGEAHRYMQRKSMSMNMRMVDYARMICTGDSV